MWYEIRTGSTECVEEVKAGSSKIASKQSVKGKGKGKQDRDGDGDAVMEDSVIRPDKDSEDIDFGDIGGIEEQEPERIAKLKVHLPLLQVSVAKLNERHQ
jgi:hypothetical protein